VSARNGYTAELMQHDELSPHPVERLHQAEGRALELGLRVAAEREHEPEHRDQIERVGRHYRSGDGLSGGGAKRAKNRYSGVSPKGHETSLTRSIMSRTTGHR
jgi:hypothetical protein